MRRDRRAAMERVNDLGGADAAVAIDALLAAEREGVGAGAAEAAAERVLARVEASLADGGGGSGPGGAGGGGQAGGPGGPAGSGATGAGTGLAGWGGSPALIGLVGLIAAVAVVALMVGLASVTPGAPEGGELEGRGEVSGADRVGELAGDGAAVKTAGAVTSAEVREEGARHPAPPAGLELAPAVGFEPAPAVGLEPAPEEAPPPPGATEKVAGSPAGPSGVGEARPRGAEAATAEARRERPRASRSPALDLEGERRLILAARAALTQGEPALAVESLTEHRRRFAGGLLGEERELLWIQALLALGRRDAATRRADRFRRAHSGSIHLPVLDALLEAGEAREVP